MVILVYLLGRGLVMMYARLVERRRRRDRDDGGDGRGGRGGRGGDGAELVLAA